MYKFILVDDECVIAESFRDLVDWNALGYECVKTFSSGAEAIAFLDKNRVDLVVTDISMPEISGIELSKYVYENSPSTMVVFLSAYDELDYAKEGMRYNVRFYLNKPLTIHKLRQEFLGIKEYLDAEKQKNDFIEASIYTGYFNGLIRNSFDYGEYDFRGCRFCLFEMTVSCDISEKLTRALYNIFILTYKEIKFCILKLSEQGYTVLLFSRGQIPENCTEVYRENIKDSLELEIAITQIYFFDAIEKLKEYYQASSNVVSADNYGFKVENAVVQNAILFIDNNLSKPLSQEMVAKECFVSTSWLSRLFKKHVGQNMSIYIVQKRIELGKRLLTTTDFPVHEIAEKIGIRNQSYFYAIFKECVGMTPQDYRKYRMNDKDNKQ